MSCTQVKTLTDRLSNLEEHVTDLSTDVRLQARRSTIAAQVAPLALGHAGSHNGTNSLGCSASGSARGELGAAYTWNAPGS
jgi:hypothetical protein